MTLLSFIKIPIDGEWKNDFQVALLPLVLSRLFFSSKYLKSDLGSSETRKLSNGALIEIHLKSIESKKKDGAFCASTLELSTFDSLQKSKTIC